MSSAARAVRNALDYAENKRTISRSSSKSGRSGRIEQKLIDLRLQLYRQEQERQRQHQLYIQQWQWQQRQLYQQQPKYLQYPPYPNPPMYRQYQQPPHQQYIQRRQTPLPPHQQRIDLKKLPTVDEYCIKKDYEKKKGFTNAMIPPQPPEGEDTDAFCKRHHYVKKSQTNALTPKALKQPIVLKTKRVSPKVSPKTPKVSPKTKRTSSKALSKAPNVLPVIRRFIEV
jgi:hypothetical protein